MYTQERITAFAKLGETVDQIEGEEMAYIYETAKSHNGWFTRENIDIALGGILKWLTTENLEKWINKYNFPKENSSPQTIGIVMAGNIPLVGFHDFLSVLITGNIVQTKMSSQDPFLIKYLVEKLIVIEPRFRQHIEFTERLHQMDAVIATGSDNTSRYFDYYFGKYPHIIRKNRVSCAILNGDEDQSDFLELGKDIFYYFGLGCRNVSKLYVPKNYDFKPLIESMKKFDYIMDNHKYANNYNYNRSIFLVGQTPHLDTGFCLFQPHESLASPTSVIFFEEYLNEKELKEKLSGIHDKIQCTVSGEGWFKGSLPFGQAQEPQLWDYADHVDTVKFLLKLTGV